MNAPIPKPNDDRHEVGAPHVSQETIDAFLSQPHNFDELFNRIRSVDPHLARFVMTRATQLEPKDMKAREHAARLTLEALTLERSQTEAGQLEEWLNENEGQEPGRPTATSLPD